MSDTAIVDEYNINIGILRQLCTSVTHCLVYSHTISSHEIARQLSDQHTYLPFQVSVSLVDMIRNVCDKYATACHGQMTSHEEGNYESADERHARKMRRKADEIERQFECYVRGCSKSYGSEGALRNHYKQKHGNDYCREYVKNVNTKQKTKKSIQKMANTGGYVDYGTEPHMRTIRQQGNTHTSMLWQQQEGGQIGHLSAPVLPTSYTTSSTPANSATAVSAMPLLRSNGLVVDGTAPALPYRHSGVSMTPASSSSPYMTLPQPVPYIPILQRSGLHQLSSATQSSPMSMKYLSLPTTLPPLLSVPDNTLTGSITPSSLSNQQFSSDPPCVPAPGSDLSMLASTQQSVQYDSTAAKIVPMAHSSAGHTNQKDSAPTTMTVTDTNGKDSAMALHEQVAQMFFEDDHGLTASQTVAVDALTTLELNKYSNRHH